MRIAVIGAGNVGAATAMRIAEADLADVVLIDIVEGKAAGIALDISSASAIVRHSRSLIGSSDYADLEGAEIVVMTAGFARKPGESRDDLLLKNAAVVKEVAAQIARYCPEAIVIVVTNPLDAMAYLLYKTTNFACAQIIGMGGTSDCARLNMLIADELNTNVQNIQSMIIGAHGDSMVVLPRLCTVQGIPISDLLSEEKVSDIIEQTRHFGAHVVELLGQGSAYYGPSAGVLQLVDAIVHDRKSVLCASTFIDGQYGLNNIFIGIPVKIGRSGIEEIIELELNEEEKTDFIYSVNKVRETIEKLDPA
ncbi:MAG: malate dehydrogenase [Candidatus Omnitrophota bacterium]